MAEATGTGGGYKVHAVDTSSPESLADSYSRAAEQGEIAASVWDGQRVNIITRTGTAGDTGKSYKAVVAKSGSAAELEQSITEASSGGRVISAVWDGQNVNLIVEE
jgi:hypothetical protein